MTITTPTAPPATSPLDSGAFGAIRRNHGLEHATIHLLSRKIAATPGRMRYLAGISHPGGFFLLGDLPPAEIETAAKAALERLRNGEKALAIHPNCGTNLLTSATLAAIAGLLMFGGMRSRGELTWRFPNAITAIVVALIIAQPLGLLLQRDITTSANVGDMQVLKVAPVLSGPVVIHHVTTG